MEEIELMENYFQKFLSLSERLKKFNEEKIPLCAAENVLSEFSKNDLCENFAHLYAMGNLTRDISNDFIGSQYIFELYDILSELCKNVFGADYTDARTLSGMNCDLTVFMSLLKSGDKVLLTTPEQGGHASVPRLLDALNIKYESIPYDYDNYQINYSKFNSYLSTGNYDAVIFCQSDLLQPPDLDKCKFNDTLIIYDATQTLGLIAGKTIPNPLNWKNCVLIGGTHKTLPGPTCGLVLCNDENLSKTLDKKINPDYIRNVQPDKIAQLVLTLIEQYETHFSYIKNIAVCAKKLGGFLEDRGFNLAKIFRNRYTETHQLFIKCNKAECDTIYQNSLKYNVTLNKKDKLLFGGYGIRLGVQEIARFNWDDKLLQTLADLLSGLTKENENKTAINLLRKQLIENKIPHFTYNEITIE